MPDLPAKTVLGGTANSAPRPKPIDAPVTMGSTGSTDPAAAGDAQG